MMKKLLKLLTPVIAAASLFSIGAYASAPATNFYLTNPKLAHTAQVLIYADCTSDPEGGVYCGHQHYKTVDHAENDDDIFNIKKHFWDPGRDGFVQFMPDKHHDNVCVQKTFKVDKNVGPSGAIVNIDYSNGHLSLTGDISHVKTVHESCKDGGSVP